MKAILEVEIWSLESELVKKDLLNNKCTKQAQT